MEWLGHVLVSARESPWWVVQALLGTRVTVWHLENWTNWNLTIKTAPHHILDMNGYAPVYSRVSYRSRPKESSLLARTEVNAIQMKSHLSITPYRTLRPGTESLKAARTSYLLRTFWSSSQYSCWADVPVFPMELDHSMYISASLLHSPSTIPAILLIPLHGLLRGFTSLSSSWIICFTFLFPWVARVLYSCYPTCFGCPVQPWQLQVHIEQTMNWRTLWFISPHHLLVFQQ